MREFKVTTIQRSGSFSIEFSGESISDVMYRQQSNGIQRSLTFILKHTSMDQPLNYDKMNHLCEGISENIDDPNFFLEYGFNELRGWIRIYNLNREMFYENLKMRKDFEFMQERYGIEKTFGTTNSSLDNYLDEHYPIRNVYEDLIGSLERTSNGNIQIDFMDGNAIVAKSYGLDSKITCFNRDPKDEQIMCFIQLITKDEAMDLSKLNNNQLKNFVGKYTREIQFPFHMAPHLKYGSTMYGEVNEDIKDEMTKDLWELGILDSCTQVDNAWLLMPNFETEAVKKGSVKWEFGLQIHVCQKKDRRFQFYI